MYQLAIYQDAEADLERLWDKDESSAAEISALLEELGDDQIALEDLSIRGHNDGRMDVKFFESLQRTGLNIWRLRIWSLEGDNIHYRIIYALDGPRSTYHVLALMHRGQNYEQDSELISRIKRAYADLGLPEIPYY